MKYRIERTVQFKKDFKLAARQGLKIEKLKLVVSKLANGEKLSDECRDHGLKGNYRGYRECHIEPDWLLIYKKENDILVLSLVRTGSHSQLFRE